MKHLIKYTILFLGLAFALIGGSHCKRLVEVDTPVTSISSENAFASDATAAAVLTGIYTNMSGGGFSSGGFTSMSLFPALSADELTLVSGLTNATYTAYYTNSLSSTNITVGASDFWSIIYPFIYVANSAIIGLVDSTRGTQGVTPVVRQRLTGEAKFVRAFCYFYLTNLYGDVPLVLGTDYTKNSLASRTPKALVWQQIITDLKDAQGLLDSNYVDATIVGMTAERTRPNYWAATALLARAYLYTGDWVDAETQASIVIGSPLFALNGLDSAFLANNNEAIWQLQPVAAQLNTQDAVMFVLPSDGPSNIGTSFPVYLNTSLLNAFEANDQRRAHWVDSVIANGITYFYPFKYKVNTAGAPVTEYLMVLRLAEQYLIRAEARAQQGNTAGSAADLDMIRTRAGLGGTAAATTPDLLTAILHERQVELFTEWGHRWLDLKRTGSVDSVMSRVTPQKGGSWRTEWQWYPLSLYELQHDPNLVQNSGC